MGGNVQGWKRGEFTMQGGKERVGKENELKQGYRRRFKVSEGKGRRKNWIEEGEEGIW